MTFFSNASEFSCTSIKPLCYSRNISFSNPEASADSARDAGQFVEHSDGLFNTFYSQTVKTSQRLGHAFSDKSGHL